MKIAPLFQWYGVLPKLHYGDIAQLDKINIDGLEWDEEFEYKNPDRMGCFHAEILPTGLKEEVERVIHSILKGDDSFKSVDEEVNATPTLEMEVFKADPLFPKHIDSDAPSRSWMVPLGRTCQVEISGELNAGHHPVEFLHLYEFDDSVPHLTFGVFLMISEKNLDECN